MPSGIRTSFAALVALIDDLIATFVEGIYLSLLSSSIPHFDHPQRQQNKLKMAARCRYISLFFQDCLLRTGPHSLGPPLAGTTTLSMPSLPGQVSWDTVAIF